MGQAWCKERTTKAQDSKSPLDRVFVRCAHQIYPTLKQDGSVLGGATQRVTSSEIGYAGSPPREVLTRGQSVDSIDRPFHPSDWIDVNLEVPSTPSSVITNLTANTNLYPTTTTVSSTGSKLKNVTPVPPPRKRRKNRGRPLPPKPDEIIETQKNGKKDKKIEPLYSSVKSQKIREAEKRSINEISNEGTNDRKDEEKEIHEHKVNGTGKIVAITNVKGEENRRSENSGEGIEKKEINVSENRETKNKTKNENKNNNNVEVVGPEEKINNRDLEYEKFSKSKDLRTSSSTPNGPANNSERESSSGKDLREFVSRTIMDEDDDDVIKDAVQHIHKNYSTVSLPNYDELEVVKKEVERDGAEDSDLTNLTPKKPGRIRNVSTISLPPTNLLSPLPQATTERLENYMTRCRSFGSLQPGDILDKINAHGEQIESSDEDEWCGLDDWDLGVAEYTEPSDGDPPLVPNSRLRERKGTAPPPNFSVGKIGADKTKQRPDLKVDIAKSSSNGETGLECDKTRLNIPRNSSFEMPKSPNSLKSALKLEPNRKISMPAKLSSDKPSSPLEDWFSAQERSVRFFDVPKLEEENAKSSSTERKLEQEYDTKSYPFNGVPTAPLNIDNFFGEAEEFGAGIKNSRDSRVVKNRANLLTRSLSNESEPFDGYEEKELTLEIRSQPSSIGKLSRTISDESIPTDMVAGVEDTLDEKMGKSDDRVATRSKDSKTPPPSPEPRIQPDIVEVEHLTGNRSNSLKMQKEDEGESNLSSMTPSLTELEAALSDMLEKEENQEEEEEEKLPRNDKHDVEDSQYSNLRHSEIGNNFADDKPIEPKILINAEEKNLFVRKRKDNNIAISLGQILNNSDKRVSSLQSDTGKLSDGIKGDFSVIPGKNPFEDTDEEDGDGDGDGDVLGNKSRREFDTFKATNVADASTNPFDLSEPPEKPSRLLYKVSSIDQNSPEITIGIPTPPQRKNKHGTAALSPTQKNHQNFDLNTELFPITDSAPHPNDRLI